MDSSHQTQSYSNVRDFAYANDFDMLADSDITGIKLQASEEMEWSINSNISKIAQESWNDGGSQLAQRAWEAMHFAYGNDCDMLDLPPSFDSRRLNGYYRQWSTAQSTYP